MVTVILLPLRPRHDADHVLSDQAPTKYLPEQRFKTRGTVCPASKGEYVKALVGNKFEYIIVPDVNAVSAGDGDNPVAL